MINQVSVSILTDSYINKNVEDMITVIMWQASMLAKDGNEWLSSHGSPGGGGNKQGKLGIIVCLPCWYSADSDPPCSH